jgi:hypothetical protein
MTSDGKVDPPMSDETVCEAPSSSRSADFAPLRERCRSSWTRAEAADTVFEVVVAVVWSGGELLESEVERGRATADVLGVRPRGGGAFAAIADGPLPLPKLHLERLEHDARRLAYAASEWVDTANTEPSARRSGFLRALATLLQLDQKTVEALRRVVNTTHRLHAEPRESFAALCEALLRGSNTERTVA